MFLNIFGIFMVCYTNVVFISIDATTCIDVRASLVFVDYAYGINMKTTCHTCWWNKYEINLPTRATSGAGNVYPSGALEFTPQSLVFWVVFCRPLSVLLLAIVLSVLQWFTASDYPFGIFKLYFFVRSSLAAILNQGNPDGHHSSVSGISERTI